MRRTRGSNRIRRTNRQMKTWWTIRYQVTCQDQSVVKSREPMEKSSQLCNRFNQFFKKHHLHSKTSNYSNKIFSKMIIGYNKQYSKVPKRWCKLIVISWTQWMACLNSLRQIYKKLRDTCRSKMMCSMNRFKSWSNIHRSRKMREIMHRGNLMNWRNKWSCNVLSNKMPCGLFNQEVLISNLSR